MTYAINWRRALFAIYVIASIATQDPDTRGCVRPG